MPDLPYHLERTVVIRARPETVFSFFTDSERWAKWWGPGSSIDSRPGGKVYIRHPNKVESVGEILEIQAPRRLVFTYGYASGKPIPPGSSRVTIRLEPDADGTRLHLLHEFADPAARDEHVQGWRFQLSVFGNVVADEAYSKAVDSVDTWFRAWAIVDDTLRAKTFAEIAAPEIRFRDRFSVLTGLEDLLAHSGAAQRFMPGISMSRRGEARHCQGSILADWVFVGSDGKEQMSGTNLFVFQPDGKIELVTGFANPSGGQ